MAGASQRACTRAMATPSGQAQGAEHGRPEDVPHSRRIVARLADEVGAPPPLVQAVLTQTREMAITTLQSMKPFRLRGIASFRRRSYAARRAATMEIRGYVFKTQPLPATKRVNCRVTSVVERAVLAASPATSKSPTPGVFALAAELAGAIATADITTALVVKILTALRNIVIEDLRATGRCVLDGFVRFVRVDVKARQAHYGPFCGKMVLHKAKGSHRRVYGRVPS